MLECTVLELQQWIRPVVVNCIRIHVLLKLREYDGVLGAPAHKKHKSVKWKIIFAIASLVTVTELYQPMQNNMLNAGHQLKKTVRCSMRLCLETNSK